MRDKSSELDSMAPDFRSSGLKPYTGPWDRQFAAHLLKRTTFGPSFENIKYAEAIGLAATAELLLAEKAMPDPPRNYSNQNDPVPIGEVWVEAPMPQNTRGSRRKSMLAWTVMQQFEEGISIREQMTLFWHNHFATEKGVVADPRFWYQHQSLLRSYALGNFKTLVEKITVDPMMLRYLDGRSNTKNKPNENYARELLELFTIGKGPIAGPGDYTHFTEDDVIAISKVLTGWRDYNHNSKESGIPYSQFLKNNHHTGDKQLSHRFDNIIISNEEEHEYLKLIDIIFSKAEVAYFICRKLYRWFVNYDINAEIEEEIIKPLGALMIAEQFEIKPVLENLICSEHFFDQAYKGAVIKNPMVYTVSLLCQGKVNIETGLYKKYLSFWKLYQFLETAQMAYFVPPNVAGWPAFYQEPVFYQSWINTATLAPRNNLAIDLTNSRGWGSVRIKMDVLSLVAGLDKPKDPNTLIEELSLLFFPHPLESNQIDFLKAHLIPGLPDFEWTVEYNEYLENQEDEQLKVSVEQRLLNLMQAMVTMPEVHLN